MRLATRLAKNGKLSKNKKRHLVQNRDVGQVQESGSLARVCPFLTSIRTSTSLDLVSP